MDFNSKITMRADMKKNEGLSSFLNFVAQQHHNAFEVFYHFISEVKPVRILEIGTALGGFTGFLNWVSEEINHPIDILSLEIREMPWYKDIRKENIDIKIQNVFSENFDDVDDFIKEFVGGEGTTIVLCDGGNKVGEFNVLSNFLKNGDYILAHDYAEDTDSFNEKIKNKIWNWHEISYGNISESCERNNLINYKKDEFEQVVWTCWKK
jgi:cephalosporin hydroxylase